MSDRELRLRIGAAIDSSFTQVMGTVVDAAKRARKQIAAEMKAGAKEGAKAEVEAGKEGERAIKAKVQVAKTAKQQADAMAADVLRVAKKNAAENVAIQKSAMSEVERDLRAHNRLRKQLAADAAKAEGALQKKGNPGGLSRGGAVFMRAGAAAVGMGMRMGSSILHGMGIDPSINGQLAGSRHRQSLAIDVASQGYIGSGKGPEGSQTYTNPEDIMASARAAGSATGTKTEDMLEGLNKFVKMTGDLKTARDSMAEIGKIAKANGADFGEMMEASANISIAMGDIANKGPNIAAVMRTLAGQGHLGAVSIADQARQIGKITAQANFYKIDPRSANTLHGAGVDDPTGQRIAVLGALQQWSRAKGGRVTAAQASQSAMKFIADLANPTEVKRMAGHGINVWADAGKTQVRDPLQMFLEVARKAQSVGGLNKSVLNDVFTNKQSRATAEAMTQDYNAKYREAAEMGITDETLRHKHAAEGLTEVFQNYLRVTQGNAEVSMKFGKAMEGAESQANIMNNALGKASDEMMSALLPAVQALAPVFVALATTGADALSRILGIDNSEQAKAGKLGSRGSASIGALSAAIDDATKPDHITMSPSGQQTGWVTSKGTLNAKDESEAKALVSELKKAIAQKQAVVAAGGETGAGMLGMGKSFKNMTDKELRDEANNPLGDVMARNYMKDKAQLDTLNATLEKLSTALDKVDVLRGAGKIDTAQPMPVVIHGDLTSRPPGAKPHTSGTSEPNASVAP